MAISLGILTHHFQTNPYFPGVDVLEIFFVGFFDIDDRGGPLTVVILKAGANFRCFHGSRVGQ